MPRQLRTQPLWSRPVWSLLFSLKVGLVLLGLLVAGSIYGTLVSPPQGVSQYDHAIQVVFKSWWYQGLMILLAVNMLLSTYRNIIVKLIPAMKPRFLRGAESYTNIQPSGNAEFGGDWRQIERAFGRRGYRIRRDGDFGYAVRGAISRWGAPIAHIGMALLLIGGFFAYGTMREGYIIVNEGEQTDHMLPRGSKDGRLVPLGFTVRCDDFDTDYFPRTRIPSHYVSTVTIFEPGREPQSGQVEVNQSMHAQGWKLHQTSYREIPGRNRYRIEVAGGSLPTSVTLELSAGQVFPLNAEGDTLHLGFERMPRWQIARGAEVAQQGVLGGASAVDACCKWSVRLIKTTPLFETTLSVTSSPFVSIAYTGCALMIVGLLIAFFVQRGEIFLCFDPRRQVLSIVGIYRHPRETLDSAAQGALRELTAQAQTQDRSHGNHASALESGVTP